MASGAYNRGKFNLMKKLMDMDSDTFDVILLDNDHAFDADDNVETDVNSNEIAPGSAFGYSTGGETMTGLTVTQDDTNDCATWDADNVVWTDATFSAYHAVIVDRTVSDNLVLSIDFGGIKSVSSGTFTISWSANGIWRLA